MSRAPDLSGFKIARKGAARPIEPDAALGAATPASPASASPAPAVFTPADTAPTDHERLAGQPGREQLGRERPGRAEAAGSGRLLATTVKLDEDRYMRLQDAARPVPGRPRRRTTQDILTEALDEWLARRGL